MENSEQRRKCGKPTISSPFLKIEGVLIDKSEHNRIWNWSLSNGRNLGCNTGYFIEKFGSDKN